MNKLLLCVILFSSLNISAQDWANLKRYQEDNISIISESENNERVVFMGNSITEFWRPGFFQENASFVNRGISGQTTPQMLLRFRQDVIDLSPSAVVILAGINDIAHNKGPSTVKMIADNIFSMAELAKSNNIEVLLCSVLPANNFPWRKEIKPAEKVIALNSLIKEFSEKHNIAYVDYYSAMVNDEKGLKADLGPDGVHPNSEGYTIMESIITKAISNSIRTPDLPDPLKAGWKNKKVCEVLKEDDSQRILKCTFPPNVGHEKHYHAPHFGYTLKGGTFKITDAKGTKEINVKDGTTWSKSELSVHEVINVGETTSVYLIIEPKN